MTSQQLTADGSGDCFFSLAAAGSLTTYSRVDAGAWFNYTFLPLKERDIETGLDYFLARYYSSTQGRFTSPDEFTGGPDELYTFADDASNNPTFYANLGNPQSLNKYQYAYNNPLRYVDPDGHDPLDPPQNPTCPCTMTPAQAEQMKRDLEKGLDWVAGVTGITAVADWLRTNGPAVGKAILDHGGKSAMQQDMDDLAGRYPGSKTASSQKGQQSQQGQSNTASPNPDNKSEKPKLESTPSTAKKAFESVRGTNGKRNKETGEIWVKDTLHKDHYEVYKNKRDFERGRRSRSVWEDGRPKEKF